MIEVQEFRDLLSDLQKVRESIPGPLRPIRQDVEQFRAVKSHPVVLDCKMLKECVCAPYMGDISLVLHFWLFLGALTRVEGSQDAELELLAFVLLIADTAHSAVYPDHRHRDGIGALRLGESRLGRVPKGILKFLWACSACTSPATR
jgi:hypothetical protein